MRRFQPVLAVFTVLLATAAIAAAGTAWLGVLVVDQGDSVVVKKVLSQSPAERSGLVAGDHLVTVGEVQIDSPADVVRVIRSLEPGAQVELTVDRDGQRIDLQASLDERPVEMFSDKSDRHREPHSYHFSFGTPRARLGVEVQELSDGLRTHFGVEGHRGVLVAEVSKDSPAERAGLLAGDVIVAVAGEGLSSADEIRRALRGRDAGEEVEITIVRDRHEQTVWATLEEVQGRSGHGRHHRFLIDVGGFGPEEREEINRSLEIAAEELELAFEQLDSELGPEFEEMFAELGHAFSEEVGPALAEVFEALADIEIDIDIDVDFDESFEDNEQD